MSSKSRDESGLEDEVAKNSHDEGGDEGEEDGQNGDGFVVRSFLVYYLTSVSSFDNCSKKLDHFAINYFFFSL